MLTCPFVPENTHRFEVTYALCPTCVCFSAPSMIDRKSKAASVAGGDGAQHDDQLPADQEQAETTLRHGRRKASRKTIRNGESGVVSSKNFASGKTPVPHLDFMYVELMSAQQSRWKIVVSCL